MMPTNLAFHDLDYDMLHRVSQNLDVEDISALRASCTVLRRALKDIDRGPSLVDIIENSFARHRVHGLSFGDKSTIDRAGVFIAGFQPLQTPGSGKAQSWSEAVAVQAEQFEEHQIYNATRRTFISPQILKSTTSKEFLAPPAWLSPSALLDSAIASTNALLAETRAYLKGDSPGFAASRLNVLALTPWADYVGERLVESLGCTKKQIIERFIEDFLRARCPLGVELCLRKLAISDWHDLPAGACSTLLLEGPPILQALSVYQAQYPRFLEVCRSLVSYPVDSSRTFDHAMKRTTFLWAVVESGHLDLVEAARLIRQFHHADVAEENSNRWLWNQRAEPEDDIIEMELQNLRGAPRH